MAILLSGVICVSNCVPSFASETAIEHIAESETDGDIGSASTEIKEENQGEVGNTGSEQGQEGGESGNEAEQGGEENTVESTEDNSTKVPKESRQEARMSLSAETGTFTNLEELKTFYESNNTGALQNALDFANYNNKIIGANANGLILLSCVENESFEGYTIKLSGLSGGGSNLASQIEGFPAYTFKGLGRSGSPFKGTITVSDSTTGSSIDLTQDRPFFNTIDVASAKIEGITTINITTARESVVAFAQEVSGSAPENTWDNVEVNIKAYTYVDNEATTITYPGSCIGMIRSNANFSLKKIGYQSAAKVNETAGNAGLLCNEIESNAKFQVGSVVVSGSVSIIAGSGKAAGGLLVICLIAHRFT